MGKKATHASILILFVFPKMSPSITIKGIIFDNERGRSVHPLSHCFCITFRLHYIASTLHKAPSQHVYLI